MNITSCGVALTAVLSMATASAQESGAETLPSAPSTLLNGIVPIHTAADEGTVRYGIWGAAEPHFKASFHDGMTFVPYLGSEYPRNQPWRWRTTSVTSGTEVLLQADEEAEPVQVGDTRYEYRFQAVVEAYELRADALEQTFVFAERPAAPGDLVVRGRVDTLLDAASVAAAHRELVFRDRDGAPIVGYGAAFVVGAAGERIPIATAWDGEQVTLTVPASFVAAASFPLTIDPLLTRRSIAYSDTVILTDVCRDADSNQVMFAYTRAVSIVDFDAFARIANDALTSSVSVFTDVATGWSNPGITCAQSGISPSWYCLVIVRGAGALPRYYLRFQVRAASDISPSTAVQYDLVTPAGSHYTNPDVGGIHDGASFLLAFQRDYDASPDTSEVWAASIGAGGVTGIGGATVNNVFQPPKWRTGGDAAYPSVSQSTTTGSGGPRWGVCWQEWSGLPQANAWDIVVRRVTPYAATSGGLVLGAVRQKVGPQISGEEGYFAVAYAASSVAQLPGKVLLKKGYGVDVVTFYWDLLGSPSEICSNRLLDSSQYTGARWQVGGISYDFYTQSHWSLMLHESPTGNSYAARVGYQGQATEGPLLLVDGPPSSVTVPGSLTYDWENERWVLGWGKGGDVRGNHFVYRTPAPVQTTGAACGPGGIEWYYASHRNHQQIGCRGNFVHLWGMPANALNVVVLGFPNGSVPLPTPLFANGCYQHLDILAISPLGFGDFRWFSFALPEGLLPGTLHFQGCYSNSSVTALYTTERVDVPIVK